MLKARRRGKLWLLFGACAGLVLALAYGSVSGLMYAVAQTPARAEDRTPVTIDRAPQRVIKDRYPSFSAVAIDPEENMLVVTDENLFQILEYDRRENTPPSARLTEPKRVISGPNTRAEMLCGVYIDPVTRKYMFSTMTHRTGCLYFLEMRVAMPRRRDIWQLRTELSA